MVAAATLSLNVLLRALSRRRLCVRALSPVSGGDFWCVHVRLAVHGLSYVCFRCPLCGRWRPPFLAVFTFLRLGCRTLYRAPDVHVQCHGVALAVRSYHVYTLSLQPGPVVALSLAQLSLFVIGDLRSIVASSVCG
jgi:hypothetical protein